MEFDATPDRRHPAMDEFCKFPDSCLTCLPLLTNLRLPDWDLLLSSFSFSLPNLTTLYLSPIITAASGKNLQSSFPQRKKAEAEVTSTKLVANWNYPKATQSGICFLDIIRYLECPWESNQRSFWGTRKPNGLRFLVPRPNGKSTGNRLLLALGMSADEAQPQRPKARPWLRDFTDKTSLWSRITLRYQLFL
ncbi:hypothetical protein AgCh_000867 [Apium graveolens]